MMCLVQLGLGDADEEDVDYLPTMDEEVWKKVCTQQIIILNLKSIKTQENICNFCYYQPTMLVKSSKLLSSTCRILLNSTIANCS